MRIGDHLYTLASRRNGTPYVGVTAGLVRRIAQHRSGEVPGFTSTYGVGRLVYAEWHADTRDAIERVKRWRRTWKLDLIEALDPAWQDFYPRSSERLPARCPASFLFPPSRPPSRDPGRTPHPPALDPRVRGDDG